MTSSIPYLTAEINKSNHTVHLLIINNNHFNALNVKINANFHISKRLKKDYKKKCESIVEKDYSFMGDYSTVYSKNNLIAIKEYLEKNTYPEEITSLDCQKQKIIEKGILEKLWKKPKVKIR